MRRLVVLGVLCVGLAAAPVSGALAALVNGTLPAAGFTWTSVTDNAVDMAGGGVTVAAIARLEAYIDRLARLTHPTAAQTAALAAYRARLADFQARHAAGIDLRAAAGANVKTTYSRVAPDPTFEAGWHYHNGPVIVSVTVGTLTFFDAQCGTWDLTAGHSYIEPTGRVVNVKVLPAKNAGVTNVEWFTTRLYPGAAIDPAPVTPPCTP